MVGEGLILSEGDEWRHQRRTIAPSLSPRVIPMLARHVAAATEPVIARFAASASGPIELLSTMQLLTLEIAARSMFSLEIARLRSGAAPLDGRVLEPRAAASP
jgi:cytochrome P450